MIYQGDTTIVFSYKLSNNFVSKVFIETGKMLAVEQKLVVKASELTENERHFLVEGGMPLKETVHAKISGFFRKFLSIDDINLELEEYITWN